MRTRSGGRRRRRNGGTLGARKNLLSTLAKCEFCGNTMVFIDKGKTGGGSKLRCGRAHAGAKCAHRALYDYKWLEMGVVHDLGQIDQALPAEEAKRDEIEHRLNNIIDLVAASDSGAKVAAQVATLERELEAENLRLSEITRDRNEARSLDITGAVTELADMYRNLKRESSRAKL